MATPDNEFIVAIELGSSKIAGIAGKKKEGSLQILAYAEEKTAGCIRRGVVYNIEKTHQCINSVINKLEQTLKTKITRAYVGIGGQSMRSYKCIIKRNMLTQSYITNEAIDEMCRESYQIPFSDCEVLENFPQEYKIDSNTLADPVGVMGTNIEGEFLDIIARQKLKLNIETAFANTNIIVEDKFIAPLYMANNVLTDAEKRSGCALVDLGADTTTLIIYKNNIVRHLVTIPLGCNNINKDLATLPIDEAETEDIKLKYGDACAQDSEINEEEDKTYTTTDGRQIDVETIKNVIEARMTEIIANIRNQLINSNYNSKLLSGLVLTGGGSNMKNVVEAFKKSTKIDKVRIAKKVNFTVVKTSSATGFNIDNSQNNTILSLLYAGSASCGGNAVDNTDLFDKQQKDEEIRAAQEAAKEAAEKEAANAVAFDKVKNDIRNAYTKVQEQITELNRYGKSKDVRKQARQFATSIFNDAAGDKYTTAAAALQGKDKFKQSLKEGEELVKKLEQEVDKLIDLINTLDEQNSAWGRFKTIINSITDEN